jgi:hypothetical protein
VASLRATVQQTTLLLLHCHTTTLGDNLTLLHIVSQMRSNVNGGKSAMPIAQSSPMWYNTANFLKEPL